MKWSFSAHRAFNRCQRQWYFRTLASGGSRSRNPLVREASRLSKIQTIDAWRGSLVDDAIDMFVVPRLIFKASIELDRLLDATRALYERRLVAGLERKSIDDKMVRFLELEEGNESVPPERFGRAWEEIRASLTNLSTMDNLFDELWEAETFVSQRRLTFSFHTGYVTATPDLIAFYKNRPPLIVDWKVLAGFLSNYRQQLHTYAFAVSRTTPHKDYIQFAQHLAYPEKIRLAEAQLLTNTLLWHEIATADIEGLQNWIAMGMDEMALAREGEFRASVKPEDLPGPSDPETCQRCPFRNLCWERLNPGEIKRWESYEPTFFQF